MEANKKRINSKDHYLYSRRIEKIKNLDGFLKFKELSKYRLYFFIYKDNFITLKKQLVDYYKQIDIVRIDSLKRWHKQRKIIKSYHNLISSSQSFIEYLKRDKKMIGFENEFNDKVEHYFIDNELHQFIIAVRNFITHIQSLPLITRHEMRQKKDLSFDSKTYESIDKIKITTYLKSENKNNYKLALSYIEKSPEHINLNEIFADYDKLLTSFYSWFITKLIKVNNRDLNLLISKMRDINKFASSIGLQGENPLLNSQVRHLQCLLKKAEK